MGKIADRKYQILPDANWSASAEALVQAHLSLALSKHVPGWPGATDEQLWDVAKAIVTALDETPRGKYDEF